ncbi:FitA-like ribbon-helix-helix domain-containing protein [Pseudomonas prosekii]|uniref:FitA-like ribbon-helix-helix domain-containing protein n=1 Tax=Pseudomonas prosekii TaxID=1148509 RepID=UPI00387ABC2C
MSRINVRELPEAVHTAISRYAESNNRSLEGEVRSILQNYVHSLESAHLSLTLRQSWQKTVGDNLDQLFACLRMDQFFPAQGPQSIVDIARIIGEESPGHMLDCMEGLATPSFDLLDRVSNWSGCSYNWLSSGLGTIFPVENIGSNYQDFFQHDLDNKDVTFHLLRVCGGHSDGMLLCLRHNSAKQAYAAGFIAEHFMLKDGMGATGSARLNEFIRFLKTHCGNRVLKAYNFAETGMNTLLGTHHPLYYLRSAESAGWLTQLFNGQDPSNWLKGYEPLWKDMSELPFGNGETA